MLQIPARARSFFGQARVPAARKRRGQVRRRPALEPLESRIALTASIIDLGQGVLPVGINNSGQVVGNFNSINNLHAFIYSGGSFTTIPAPSGYDTTQAAGINDSGQVTGFVGIPGSVSSDRAFLYTNGSPTTLPLLHGYDSSVGTGINGSGQVVGDIYSSSTGIPDAFLYSGGNITDLGTLGGNYSEPAGINDSGQVVGVSRNALGYDRAFLDSGGLMTDLGTLPGDQYSSAADINDSGQIVGSSGPNIDQQATHGFLYSGGVMTGLGTLGRVANDSVPRAINNIGQVVGDSPISSLESHAFIYTNSSMTDLNSLLPANSGWTLTTAMDINDHGQIVGWGTLDNDPHHITHGFILNLNSASQPVLAMNSAAISPDGQNVNATYTITGGNLASAGTIDFYWATGPNLSDKLGTPVKVPTQKAVGSYTASTSIASLGPQPANATYILAVADSPSADPAHNVASVSFLPQLDLTEATTLDAQSVTIDYMISNIFIKQPLEFDVYRSDQSTWDSTAVFIGKQTIDPSTDPQDLAIGSHVVKLIDGTSLPPNQRLPFVIVVANKNGSAQEDPASINTAYFQKFLMGVLSHGFGFTTSNATPDWEVKMGSDLQSYDIYNKVIEFNWMGDSRLPVHGIGTDDGNLLFQQVVSTADQLAAGHLGDVVDLHFIGHSRGAFIISQAMQDLVGTKDPALEGSYIKATFLDPHPAIVATADLLSWNPIAAIPFAFYEAFVSLNEDGQVVIPPNVKYTEVYYQHTNFLNFNEFSNPTEYLFNLWGEGPSDGIINNSSTNIHFYNLTDVVDPSLIPGPNGKSLGTIGHSEVPWWYLIHIVDTGLAASVV